MRTVTIVGASLAGLSAARALRAQEFAGRIVLVGDEPPYDRPPLSKDLLEGTTSAENIELTTADDHGWPARRRNGPGLRLVARGQRRGADHRCCRGQPHGQRSPAGRRT